MRKTVCINENWAFLKDTDYVSEIPEKAKTINLPHTWNALDGQDGGNDYFRGTCCYCKLLKKSDLTKAERYYLEIEGANSCADVYFNGIKLCHHDGGYSTFRVELTDALNDNGLLVISVNNGQSSTVYPQVADFTFYGGLYRSVNVICTSDTHFDLEYYGGHGVEATPIIDGDEATVFVKTFTKGLKNDDRVTLTILDKDKKPVAVGTAKNGEAKLKIKNVHLWHARRDPYLYTLCARIERGGEVLDEVRVRFGCRTFKIDPEHGFILNGEEYPLHGVARHQDRLNIGNALLPEHHKEDMELIAELGANTIRLAHYQHAQYFYDLCDEYGMVVWAEIPYISRHMPMGKENTVSQMTELIVQNYHHPSIVVWGLSNEITMNGNEDADLIQNHKILNDLCHKMDKTRLTAVAAVSPCPINSHYLEIPDVVSYNHYFGWYGGEAEMNGPWFDKFHAAHPNKPIGCSEYGAEALNWHSSKPMQGDYTEEYQAAYHEQLIKQLFSRKYIWATHVWNMFDFGADARMEGGENGQNHKGLVTMDRKYKKDAFYAYKAWLSDEPFVHIAGKRYVNRADDVTKITVYSNQPEVELFGNKVSLGKKTAADRFFYFEVKNEGKTELVAKAGECTDTAEIVKVDTPDESYRLKEKNAVLNWYDVTERDGYFSLNDKIGGIMETVRGKLVIYGLFKKIKANAKNQRAGGFEFKIDGAMAEMLKGFTVLRLTGMIGMMGASLTKEDLLSINRKLNHIKKPKV